MISRIIDLVRDPSVRWLAAARIIALVAAPFALYLLVTRQGLSLRGFYLIAINFVMMAQLFETGMGTLVVQVAARVRPSERGVLRAVAEQWFARAALVTFALGATLGTAILARGAAGLGIDYAGAWAVVLVCTAAYIRLAPLVCLHEGAGDVEAVQRMRAAQALFISAAMLGGLWQGRGIDAAAAAAVAQAGVAGLFVWRRRARLSAADPPQGRLVQEYRREQRRSAVVWFALWIAPQLLTPATMAFRGAHEAGDIGLHVALAFAPALLSVAWLHARYPRLGALVASGALRTFDDTAWHAFRQAMAVFGTASAALIALALALPYLMPFLAGRVLSVAVLAGLLAGNLMIVGFQAMLAWFRAFGDERFASQVVVACGGMTAGGVAGAALGGSLGASVGYAAVGAAVTAILVVGFLRLRSQRLAGA